MNKVYILTFVNTENYGALLQAFSLKETISEMGYECEFINYQNKKLDYSTAGFVRRIRSYIWKNMIYKFLFSKKRAARTKRFQTEKLCLRLPKYRTPEELIAVSECADIYVVGSDQVWNPELIADDESYFLSFTPCRKISFAASFGKSIVDEKFLREQECNLKNFFAISVREKTGANSLKQVLGINAEVLLDPVFLHTKEEWMKMLGIEGKSKHVDANKGYVLCYVMPGDQNISDYIYIIANRIAEQKSLKLITLKNYGFGNPRPAEKYDYDAGPIEFVEYIANADYIVTNSFHGTAFSIIFRKNFWTVMSNGHVVQRNTRMEELLTMMNLKNRGIFSDISVIETPELISVIDYENIDHILKNELSKSKKFLRKSLTKELL